MCSALTAFTEVLAAELRPLGIPVTHVRLGSFDFAGFTPEKGAPARSVNYQPGLLMGPENAEPLSWPEAARKTYGRNFVSSASSAVGTGRIRGLRGTSLRELHNRVFDVIDGSERSAVVRVGLGAGVYGFVGRWVPRGLVSWMMGVRRVDELDSWRGGSSSSGSPRPGSAGSAEGEGGGGGSEYVSVPEGLGVGDSHVWKEM